MDFLNKAFAQLGDLFRSMTPGARLTAGLLLVVVVVSLGYLFQHQVTGGDDDLFYGKTIPVTSMAGMEQAFSKANLTSYSINGSTIRVPRGQRAAYMAALADAKAMPPDFGTILREAVDKANPFESRVQAEFRKRTALQEELSQFICKMPGIENASVIVDMDVAPGLDRVKVGTATVAVKPAGSAQLEESRVESIRLLVSGAFIGLKPANVMVTDLNGNSYPADQSGDGSSAGLYARAVRRYEEELRTKIRTALSYIPNVTVTATVALTTEKSTSTTMIKNEPKTVPLNEQENSETTNEDSAGGTSGRPGAATNANTATSIGAAASKGAHKERDKTNRSVVNVPVGQERTDKEIVGLTPKLAKATIGIASSYFEKVWHERNPAKEGEEAKKPDQTAIDQIRQEVTTSVQKYVATLLPPPTEPVPDMTSLVDVTTFQDIKQPDLPLPGTGQKAMSWFGENWRTLGMVGLVVVSLVMLRSMVRNVPAPEPAPTMSLRIAATESAPQPTESPEATAAHRLRRITGSGPSLRDELSEIVKDDPDAAANILRTWIGQVG